jgi:oligosaccharide repeat unit polymerase
MMMVADNVDAGASWWAWAAAVLLVVAVYHDVRRDVRRLISARNVVLFGIFVWYVLEALQAGPAVFQYGMAAYERGILMVMLAAAAFLAGYHRSSATWFDGVGRRVSRLGEWEFRCRTLVAGVLIGLVPLVLYGFADPLEMFRGVLGSRRTWGGVLARGALGDFRAVMLMIETFLLSVAWVALLILGDRRRSRGITVLAACVLAWHMMRAYGTGSRSVVFLAFLIPAAWVYWRCDARRQRGLLIAAIPCAVLFYWFAGAMVEGRNEGRLEFTRTPSYVGHEMFRELLFIMDQVPDKRPYLYGETIAIELVNPIPRFIWETKPVGFGVTYASWQGQDALAGGPTLSPGIIGEMYVDFGVFGVVFLSVIGGFVCRAWDRLGPQATRSLPVLMFYSLGLGCLLMLGRSFSLSLFYQMFAVLICMAIVAARFPRAATGAGVSRKRGAGPAAFLPGSRSTGLTA